MPRNADGPLLQTKVFLFLMLVGVLAVIDPVHGRPSVKVQKRDNSKKCRCYSEGFSLPQNIFGHCKCACPGPFCHEMAKRNGLTVRTPTPQDKSDIRNYFLYHLLSGLYKRNGQLQGQGGFRTLPLLVDMLRLDQSPSTTCGSDVSSYYL